MPSLLPLPTPPLPPLSDILDALFLLPLALRCPTDAAPTSRFLHHLWLPLPASCSSPRPSTIYLREHARRRACAAGTGICCPFHHARAVTTHLFSQPFPPCRRPDARVSNHATRCRIYRLLAIVLGAAVPSAAPKHADRTCGDAYAAAALLRPYHWPLPPAPLPALRTTTYLAVTRQRLPLPAPPPHLAQHFRTSTLRVLSPFCRAGGG